MLVFRQKKRSTGNIFHGETLFIRAEKNGGRTDFASVTSLTRRS